MITLLQQTHFQKSRSLYNKVNEFKTFLKGQDIDLALISETWERQNQPLDSIIKIDNFKFVSNPHQRSSSTSGVRPAIFVNTSKFNVDSINQCGHTMGCGVISPKNVTNSSVVKRIAVCSFYSKPDSRQKILLDHLSQTLNQLSAEFGSGLYWIIGGDKNDLNIQQILNLSLAMKQCVQSPTRLKPSQILDVCITDLSSYYQSPVVIDPLQVDIVKTGSDSGHLMVTTAPIGSESG